ncbi:ecotropic viral integration site 5 ortholog isoform X1 [Takifugu flavidus]|uniref:TBC1 domain family member 10A EBP50-PDX interactor of 64 kDa n=1 Tax=Takifugu flavidus TaxID=433684 RepID=A0A5C6MLX8_9TELE|nr:ecotropic viral integration site 5 ortholog isoform X1 [Takifugu flavidus]TWW55628.1 TBC1 domain family member 10A EBP50-PDX interactor of 64 kDa [Takifugu flavidus]
MLSPSIRVQKDTSEEDSSGSDAGLEPEKDRFGFIVTDRSTASSVGPSPELVRQREAKWINIIVQWDQILLKRTNKIKVQCQKGIPASLRAKCWPLLCGAAARMKQNENLYQCLDSQSALQSWVDVINRDLDRQFPFHEMFLSKDGHGQRDLFQVLKSYTQYKPEEGYCQAQGPVAAVLLMNMPAEEAFWCLVQISEQYLPGYYSPLLEGVLFDAALLDWVLKRICPAAHKHLQHHDVEPLMFATDWLMCLFTRHLPFNALLRVWDLFFCYGVRVLLQVAVVLVRRALGRAEQRKKCEGQMETLERLRGIREHVQEEADAFIAEVSAVPLSARDLERQTEKEMEKWKKDRPSSTFDPRHRCTGYQMVWAVARQNQELLEKMERERGHLSLPLTRSTSMLSLSPKRWRKGGKINEGEREGGARVVRHLSMGAKDQRWTEINFKPSQRLQEDEDADSHQLIDQRETEKLNLPNMAAKPSQDSSKDQIEQEEPISTGKHESLIRETDENKKQTEEATLIDATVHHLQLAGPQFDSQSHFLEQENSKINDQDGTQKHLEGNPEPEIEENVQQSQWDTEELAAAVEKGAQSDTVSKEGENSSHGDAVKEEQHSSELITPSQTQPAAEIDGLDQTQEQEEENTKAQEDLEHSEHLHSKTEVEEILVSSNTLTGSSEGLVPSLKAAEATKGNGESSLTANSGGENSDTPTQSQIIERPSDITASPQDPDGRISLTHVSPPDVPAPEKVLGTAGEDKNTESLPETTVENDVFDPIKLTDCNIDLQGGELRTSCLAQASSRRNSRSSGDFCIRKSSSSHASRLGRRLSEDLFTVPHKPSQQQPTESNPGDKHAKPLSNLGGVNSAPDSPDVFSVKSSETNPTDQQKGTPNPQKGFSFFRKLRGQTPKNQKGTPKIQVPKIFIQDFSDGTGMEKPMKEYREEKLNSRERRRRQREQDRRTKEEKVRKKRETEQEKVTEKGKRNAQTGQDVRVQGDQEKCEGLHPGKHQSHRQRNSTSYAESYF